MNASPLPQTDSIRELANFWDTHDVTEFEDELEEVGERVFERDTRITVLLETDDANAVRRPSRRASATYPLMSRPRIST